jgi:hypothetical protein
MNATCIRLGFAMLLMAGIIIFNVYIVLTGAAGDFYRHVPGTAPQPVVQVLFEGRINSPVAAAPNGMPIHPSRFMPGGHPTKRGLMLVYASFRDLPLEDALRTMRGLSGMARLC